MEVTLEKAKLNEADLSYAEMREANLRKAILIKTDLKLAQMQNVNFDKMNNAR